MRRAAPTACAIAAGTIIATCGTIAYASRNSSGTHSLPSGNPVVTGTTITSTWANNTMGDISTELTNSLDRSGRGGMTGALKLSNGTVSAPALSFSSQTNTGLYRAGTSDLRLSLAGADYFALTPTELSLSKGLSVGSSSTCTVGTDCPLNVFQILRPISPSPNTANYPLGHDLWVQARGTADLRIQNWSMNLTSSTSVAAPGSVTITVGTPLICPSTDTADANCITPSGTTANLCLPAAGCSLIIDPDTANAETIGSSDWSIAGTNTITATFANTHTQPYTVRQIGTLDFDARTIGINRGDASDRPVQLLDRANVPFMTLTNATGGTFPKSAVQFRAIVTGDNGTNDDLLIRNAQTASCTKFVNNANTANIVSVCESAAAASVFLGGATNNSIRLSAQPDIGRIYGGGTSSGILLYGTQGSTNSDGTFRVRNNGTDEDEYFNVDTASGGTTTISGNLTVQAGPAGSSAGNPGDISASGYVSADGFHCTSSDRCGTATMIGGTKDVTVVSGCKAICTNVTSSTALKCSVTTTTLTITVAGGGTDDVNYFCF